VSEGLPEVAPVPLNASATARIRNWLRTVLGLDRAVGFTVLARFWGSAAGLVTVLLIARFLTPAEQGYYYTFGSPVAIQMIFELGFSFVILQMASHERARLSSRLAFTSFPRTSMRDRRFPGVYPDVLPRSWRH